MTKETKVSWVDSLGDSGEGVTVSDQDGLFILVGCDTDADGIRVGDFKPVLFVPVSALTVLPQDAPTSEQTSTGGTAAPPPEAV